MMLVLCVTYLRKPLRTIRPGVFQLSPASVAGYWIFYHPRQDWRRSTGARTGHSIALKQAMPSIDYSRLRRRPQSER